ncbi:MAG: sigma-70 family RNA polymerase sigma factor [Dysgonamonadaceae bacterium]|jgi:RNA polymerase sigma factor (sigma-70 family)|nr:sigma-70 family RNA polymerase sigma factor [Dysgonamonadaceae bacterium]
MERAKDIASIYKLYVNDLFTYAYYLGFDKETVMDAIHDIFCKLATEEKLLNEVENIKFYLFRALKNKLFDIYNTKKPYIGLSAVEANDKIPFDIDVSIEDKLIDTENQLLIKKQIEEMLNSLTERQREIIYLRYIQEYSYEEIAKLLNITVHGCRKLVSKALQSLREKYGALVILLLLAQTINVKY